MASNVSFGGNAQDVFDGTLYFHQCTTGGGADAGGTGCSNSAAFNDVLEFHGTSGIGTITGSIITDQVNMHGTPDITLDLNPTSSFSILKAALLQ